MAIEERSESIAEKAISALGYKKGFRRFIRKPQREDKIGFGNAPKPIFIFDSNE